MLDACPADLLELIAGQPYILLLLDFDGTLSEIVPRHEDATLRPGNADLLDALNRKPGYTVGVISGRELCDVTRRVGVPGLVYAGNHGLEIRGPDLEYRHPDVAAIVPALSETATRLADSLTDVPGALVENKTLSLTVHFRRTPTERHDLVAAIFRDVVKPLVDDGLCRVTSGKAVLELRPAVDWHKGRALELIHSQRAPQAGPVYVGDDATDEDAFRAAQAAGGFGVFVGPADSPTDANYRLESPAAVSAALANLTQYA